MYQFIPTVPPVDDFLHLREVSGLSPRPREAAEKALPNSLYGVHVKTIGQIVGMGRIAGDGALNFEIVDVTVNPCIRAMGLDAGSWSILWNIWGKRSKRGSHFSDGGFPCLVRKVRISAYAVGD